MLLAAGAGVAWGFTAACDSDSEPSVTSSQRSREPSTIENTGSIDINRAEASPGEEVVVTGSKWNGVGPISFFLLTQEQFGEGSLRAYEREAVRLGEVTADADGSVILRFRLAESYDTPDGNGLRIEAGLKLYVHAQQSTEGGAYGEGVGPLTVPAIGGDQR